MSIPLDELASPANADYFRMTVDWGRWYIDPLPTCDIAQATEDRWPSYSKIKKAADKDWSFLVVNRLGDIPTNEYRRIADLDRTQRRDALKSHEELAKQTSFGRGSIVHLWLEDLGAGREPREITERWLAAHKYPAVALEEAMRYKAAILDFWNTYQPEMIAAEYVTIHRTLNGHGYGATPDGMVLKIEGQTAAVDWKTRSDGSNHEANPEEATQIAAGARAEYMIVDKGDEARRALIPKIDVGYVVSIKTDGARLYPVDIDKAWEHFVHLHEWWVHRLDERASIGRVRPKRSTPQIAVPAPPGGLRQPAEDEADTFSAGETSSAESGSGDAPDPSEQPAATSGAGASSSAEEPRRLALLARYQNMSVPEQLEFCALGIDRHDLDAVETGLEQVDRFNVHVDPAPVEEFHLVELPTAPDEGGPVDESEVMALSTRFEKLPKEGKEWTGALVTQGNDGHPWKIRGTPTVRRFELYRGVLALAEWSYGNTQYPELVDSMPDDIIRAICHLVTEAIIYEDDQPGQLLGTLDAEQAARFADIAGDVTHDRYLVKCEDGTLRLTIAV